MPPIEFNAPWSKALKLTSILGMAVLLALVAVGLYEVERGIPWAIALVALPILTVLGSVAFMVRGYSLTEDEIQVRRVGWKVRLPLQGLQSVEGNADAWQGALRLFANGGLLSFSGYYWNRRLKLFRAFATDPSRAVILRYAKISILITPHDPQQFIMRARTYLKTLNYPR